MAGLCLAILLIAVALPALAPASSAPRGRAMWVWYLNRSAGGNVSAIAAQARSEGMNSVYVKSADGTHVWSQFSSRLVASLHSSALGVCAWQYVYGTHPVAEARAALVAVRAGADCLIIDAEVEYEGRYAAAQTYLRTLRAAVGPHYPIGLASFPYVDYHPSFPYSVFLGPGGAQFNMPQMFWGDIGESVPRVFHHTYTTNRIYRRPILPIGQAHGSVSPFGVSQFRGHAVAYGAAGISWWDFAWASANALWAQIGAPVVAAGAPAVDYPMLRSGSKGDDVVVLQEHLASLYRSQRLTGLFGDQTAGHVRAFQGSHGLAATGRTDAATWRALLALRRVDVTWGGGASVASVRGTTASSSVVAPPASARLVDRTQEIPSVGSSRSASSAVIDPSG